MPTRPIIVGLGEILWDIFPDGPRFGGAPANFACSVAELCGPQSSVHVVSGVGRDELGQEALTLLAARGVNTTCVATLDRPTGSVLVELDADRHARYTFAADTAWDNFAWSAALDDLAARADVVCFGTLGQRCDLSRQSIQRFIRSTRPNCLRIVDVNLRPPFWSEAVVLQSLELANVAKLNEVELAAMADLLKWHGLPPVGLLQQLLAKFSLRAAALTRGADGAILVDASGAVSDLPAQSTALADTVGAGDAYSAVLAVGLLNNLPLAKINAWAIRVASFVCSQPGATPRIPLHLHEP